MTAPTVTWTEFASHKADAAWRRAATWPELIERIREATAPTKAKCPWLKLATFGEARTKAGALRHDANVVEITGVEGDYDGGVVQPIDAVRMLERHGIKAVVYTSPSHTPQKPRWRVLAPLAAPHAPAARAALLARVNGALGGTLAPESFTLSQSYYFGKTADAVDYQVLITWGDPDEGRCVDEVDELDDIAVGKLSNGKQPPAHEHEAPRPGEHVFVDRVRELGRKLRTGDGRRELLKSFIASRSARGVRGGDLRLLCEGIGARYFDPADPIKIGDIANVIRWANDRDQEQQQRDEDEAAAAQRERQRQQAAAIGDGTAEAPPVAEVMSLDHMLVRLAYISDGARVAYRDRPHISLPMPEFRLHTKASETKIGKKMVPTADLWLQDHARITTFSITFRPGAQEFTADPDGRPALNLWLPRQRPASDADVSPFLDHVAYLVPDQAERERFLSWLAHIEQQPGVLPHTHYLMVTPQTGIGRNWLASALARVWAGATRLGFDLVGAMNSGFNGALSRRLLVIVDELKAADTGYGAANHAQQLKAMLTTEHRGINPKYGREHIEFNCARWLMLSQHHDALPLERSDRRVVVIDNPTERRSPAYYKRLYALLDDAAFINGIGHWLAQRNLRGFNPSEPAPLSAAKGKALAACMTDAERALVELRDGTDALVMTAADITSFLVDQGIRVAPGRSLAAAYAAAGFVPCRRLVSVEGRKARVVALRRGDELRDAPVHQLLDLLRHHS